MTLGRALRDDQTIAPFPRTQRDRIDAGLPRHFADRQPAIVEGFLEIGAEVFLGAGVGAHVHQIKFRRLRFSGCGCR